MILHRCAMGLLEIPMIILTIPEGVRTCLRSGHGMAQNVTVTLY